MATLVTESAAPPLSDPSTWSSVVLSALPATSSAERCREFTSKTPCPSAAASSVKVAVPSGWMLAESRFAAPPSPTVSVAVFVRPETSVSAEPAGAVGSSRETFTLSPAAGTTTTPP